MSYVNKVEDIKNEKAKEYHAKHLNAFKTKYYEHLGKAINATADKRAEYLADAAALKDKYNKALLIYIAS
jgi:hypothetical protein